MSLVTPRQVVAVIDKLFADTPAPLGRPYGPRNITVDHATRLQGLVDLLDYIPAELLDLPPESFADFTVAVAALKRQLANWTAAGPNQMSPHVRPMNQPVNGQDAVSMIREALVLCPDEAPPAETDGLNFIEDEGARRSLRLEVGLAHRAFRNAEWKAAAILGGAAIEALLHWKLSEPRTSKSLIDTTINAAVASGRMKATPSPSIDNWVLHTFITVAAEIGLIREDTKRQTEIAKDYRNLIHPGKAIRDQMTCDQASALAVLAGVEHVIRDLGRS